MKKTIAIIFNSLLIAGCAPIIKTQGPRAIMLDNVTRINISDAQTIAEKHCSKYKRHAVPIDYGDFNVTYECKE